MTSRGSSRRELLRMLCVGSGALAFAAERQQTSRGLSLLSARAQAAVAGAPRRLLIVFNPNGIRWDRGGADWLRFGSTQTDFELSDITQPLQRHRDQLVFFGNMIFGANTDWGNTHWAGIKTALTGAALVNVQTGEPDGWQDTNKPAGPSLEVLLGEKLGKLVTPSCPSLQINVAETRRASFTSFAMDGSPLPAIPEPWTLYERMFAGLVTGQPDPALLLRNKLRASVLDTVAKEVTAFRRRLPPEDRSRADAQLDAIRVMEQRLKGAVPASACAKPSVGAAIDLKMLGDAALYPNMVRTTSDVVKAIFACDLTRFITLGWRVTPFAHTCSFAPVNNANSEHALSHDFLDDFVKLRRWYMEELAYLADQLAAVPEPRADGEGMGSMLDNTIIVFATEISTGHAHGNMPWLTLGGRALGMNTGRALQLPTIHDNGFKLRADKGYPHGRLLLSLAKAIGAEVESVGIPSLGNQTIEGLLRV